MKKSLAYNKAGGYLVPAMTTNLTSPRYRGTIDLDAFKGTDRRFIRLGIIKLSPGQWLSHGKDKCRFVRIASNGDLWVTYGKNSTVNFPTVCKAWLKK